MISGVIFDNDGIIGDTEILHYEARRAVLERLGYLLDKETYRLRMMSRHWGEALKVCPAALLKPEHYKEMFEKMQAKYRELLDTCLRPVEGVQELVDRLRRRYSKLAIASTQPLQMVELVARRCLGQKLLDSFDVVVSGEDVKKNKPAPDVYLEAARLLRVEPKECAALEVSVPGIQSARAAGMLCIARKSEWATTKELIAARPVAVIDSYEYIFH